MSLAVETPRDLSAFQCYKCQAYGHISKDCTNGEGTKRSKDDATCYGCGEPGHIVRDCTSNAGKDKMDNNQGNMSKYQCYQCNQFGHVSKDCKMGASKEVQCYNCHQHGHVSKDCTQARSKTEGGDLTGIQCYKCNQYGHISKDCGQSAMSKERNGDLTGFQCYKCQQYGHISKECKSETNMVQGAKDLARYQCYKCGMFGHVSKDCSGDNVQDLRAAISPKDLRDRLDGQKGMGQEAALMREYQELQRQVDVLKGQSSTPSNGNYVDGDVDFMIMSCAKMLNDDIRDLIESSNRVGYGQGRDVMAIHSRLNSMKPLEAIIYQKLDQFLSQFGKTANTTRQVTVLSQHFPKLLAFLGFTCQSLKMDCMKYRSASGTVTDSVIRLATAFNDILNENGGAGKRLWPAVVSTTSLAEILIEYFANDVSF